MTGIAVIIIILVPILFQLVLLGVKLDKRHKETVHHLRRIDDKLTSRNA